MKMTPGLHLFLVGNDKGGASKSAYAAEARVACHLERVPCRLVTFDRSTQTLNEIFRGEGIHPLAKPNGDILIESFGLQMEEAAAAGELIIADMPPGIVDDDNPILKSIADSMLLREFTSISLLIPVSTHNDYVQGAFEALSAYQKIDLKYDRGLIRAWRPESTSPTWDSFPTYSALTDKFPVWECQSYMQSLSDMMQGRGKYADYPALDKLPDYYIEHSIKLGYRERTKLTAAVIHLESARKAIRIHLLDPLREREVTKSKSPAPSV
ncbi:MAG: hypothetical protein WCP45_08270 [Verrucomicrobiota bacterium]